MSKLWFTADWHLGEPRMKIMQRPHRDAQHDYEVIRDNHNQVVADDDLVIVVGDAVCMRQDDPKAWLPKVATLKGRKWLVMGNHDVIFTPEELAPFFERVITHGSGLLIDLQAPYTQWDEKQQAPKRSSEAAKKELKLYVTHYPTRSIADRFNIVGHIHGAWKLQKNMLNVGVDVHHFCPVPSEEIMFYLTAIEKFYDADVWVAGHFANRVHDATRGKLGSYFDAFTKE